jgi:cytidylate kinase
LREYGDVLNVRVVAARSIRIRRIQQEHDLNAQEARAMLDRLDSERSKYVGAYHGLNWADAGLYDLCVNTGTLVPDQTIELILQTLSILKENRDPERPAVVEVEVDPILERAINEALSLLEATGRMG